MNERIAELLKQSGYDARYCSEYFDPEKFAALIVQECLSKTQGYLPDYVIGSINEHLGIAE